MVEGGRNGGREGRKEGRKKGGREGGRKEERREGGREGRERFSHLCKFSIFVEVILVLHIFVFVFQVHSKVLHTHKQTNKQLKHTMMKHVD